MKWLEGKLPMPNLRKIMQSNSIRKEEDSMVHFSFYYPTEGGSQFIVNQLQQSLNMKTDAEVESIEKNSHDQLVINGEAFDKIIYCGDIRKFPAYGKTLMEAADADVPYLESLRSNGTSNLFCEANENDISWLYVPEDFTKAHRIIYTGNFSDTNNRGLQEKPVL